MIDASRPLVLLVEDEATLRAVIARNLSARHYQVHTASTAGEALAFLDALALLEERAPAVLLLDINLPDRSGWDVLRALRERGQTVPVIVLSAVRCSQARLDGFQPDAYFPKPFPLAALLAAVERICTAGGDSWATHDDNAAAGKTVGTTPQQEAETQGMDASWALADDRAFAARGGNDATPRGGHVAGEVLAGAISNLLMDPTSGITRITVTGGASRQMEMMKAGAIRHGLAVQSAMSPSLRQGWVKMTRAAPAPGTGGWNVTSQGVDEGSDDGRLAVHRAVDWVLRAAGGLHHRLRAAVAPPEPGIRGRDQGIGGGNGWNRSGAASGGGNNTGVSHLGIATPGSLLNT